MIERFRARLLAKLPEGTAFRRDRESWFFVLFGALAAELARVDDARAALETEAIPWLAVKLLPDWERVLLLPSVGTILERQLAVAAKLRDRGELSIPFYVSLAATLGYAITIDEHIEWRCGISDCGDAISGTEWLNTWTVTYASGANDALLEATLIGARPAHTYVHFVVDGDVLVIDGENVTSDGEPVVFA